MAKIPCPCGHVIADNVFPLEEARILLTGHEADALFGARYEFQGEHGYECPKCKRLLFMEKDSHEIVSYAREEK